MLALRQNCRNAGSKEALRGRRIDEFHFAAQAADGWAQRCASTVVLAHGREPGMDTDFMNAFAQGLGKLLSRFRGTRCRASDLRVLANV